MELLKERIRKDGIVLPGNILKVGKFLNHQIDIELLDKMGEEFYKTYKNEKVTKILTIESSGIAVACSVARLFKVPLVFGKKNKSGNIPDDCYTASVYSYTNAKNYNVHISKQYISDTDNVLLVDDFLANGSALSGLKQIAESAGAHVCGACIVIEKCFQGGGQRLREQGLKIDSLAMINSMDPETGINFYN